MNDYMKFGRMMLLAPDGAGGGAPAGEGDAQDTPGGEQQESTQAGEKPAQEAKERTFTQAELDALINKKYAKWQKDKDAAIESAKTEAERMAAMSAEEKAKHEQEKREKALADREAEITRRELRAQALETLAEKGLPKELSQVLVYTDAEACAGSIEAVEKAFRDAVQAAVDDRMKGAPPKSGASAEGTGKDEAFATQIGKNRASTNSSASDVLKHYLGG